jgi:hypothetical protein
MTLVVIQDARHEFEPPWSGDVLVQLGRLDVGHFSARGVTDLITIGAVWSPAEVTECIGPRRHEFEALLRGLARFPRRMLVFVGDIWGEDTRQVSRLAYEHGRVGIACQPDVEAATWLIERCLRGAVAMRRAN